jgi:hypothetical protein
MLYSTQKEFAQSNFDDLIFAMIVIIVADSTGELDYLITCVESIYKLCLINKEAKSSNFSTNKGIFITLNFKEEKKMISLRI